MNKLYIILILLSITAFDAAAQKDKNKNLTDIDNDSQIESKMRQFEKYYNAGRYSNALKVAKEINNSGIKLDDETNQQFLKYYICSLKEMSYDEEADSVAILFTKKYPFYKTTKFDQPVFKDLLSNFYTRPRLAVWLNGSPVTPNIQIDTIHLISDTTKIKPEYENCTGFSFEAAVQYFPFKYFSCAVGVQYLNFEYTRTLSQQITQFKYNEKNNVLSVPLYLIATMPTKKELWVPELMVGAQLDYIIKSKYNATTTFNNNQQYASSSNDIDLKEKNQINYSVIGGIRLNYNYKRLAFFIDNIFDYQIKPFNNSDYYHNNKDLLYNKMFVSDAIHIMLYKVQLGVKVRLGYTTITKYGYGY